MCALTHTHTHTHTYIHRVQAESFTIKPPPSSLPPSPLPPPSLQGEEPPKGYRLLPMDLNKGVMGPSLFLCYNTSLVSPKAVTYTPELLSRYPLKVHCMRCCWLIVYVGGISTILFAACSTLTHVAVGGAWGVVRVSS